MHTFIETNHTNVLTEANFYKRQFLSITTYPGKSMDLRYWQQCLVKKKKKHIPVFCTLAGALYLPNLTFLVWNEGSEKDLTQSMLCCITSHRSRKILTFLFRFFLLFQLD
jgi:hypothetical protein